MPWLATLFCALRKSDSARGALAAAPPPQTNQHIVAADEAELKRGAIEADLQDSQQQLHSFRAELSRAHQHIATTTSALEAQVLAACPLAPCLVPVLRSHSLPPAPPQITRDVAASSDSAVQRGAANFLEIVRGACSSQVRHRVLHSAPPEIVSDAAL